MCWACIRWGYEICIWGFIFFGDAGGAERAQKKRTAVITVLVGVWGFCWGLHKGDSPTLWQMLLSKCYVTQVSLNPKKFLLQGNSRGSPDWLSNIHPSSLSLHQLLAHHRHLQTQLSLTTNHPNTRREVEEETSPQPKGKGVKVGRGHRAHVSLGIAQIWSWESCNMREGTIWPALRPNSGVYMQTRSFISDFHCINSYFNSSERTEISWG